MGKVCKKCFKNLPNNKFRKNRASCKECLNTLRRMNRNRIRFIKWKERKKGCVDCGEKNPILLEFDHEDDKIKNISSIRYNVEDLKKEIDKCAVRCVSCHRKKTAKDFGWYEDMINIENMRLRTYSGKYFIPAKPNPKDIGIKDIAHSLSMQCRWNGHIDIFYSVAQHSVLVSHLVDEKYALAALLHDATEAYISDVPTPVKRNLPEYEIMEHQLWKVIAEKFSVPEILPEEVKEADRMAYLIEKQELVKNLEDGFHDDVKGIIFKVKLEELSFREAREQFLNRFNELTKKESK